MNLPTQWKVAIWLSLGFWIFNFAIHAQFNQDWAVAFDRSYFQTVACLMMAFVLRVEENRKARGKY